MNKNIKIILTSVLLFLLYIIPARLAPFDETWYESLIKPGFTPPQIIYPIVWTLIFLCISVSVSLTLYTKTSESKRFYTSLLILNYFFIQMYPYIQFQLKDIYLALVDVFLVLITSFMLYLTGSTLNKKASYLLIPLILWAVFASFLQVGIVKYN